MKRLFALFVFSLLFSSCHKEDLDYIPKNNVVRILAIGNSFSQDALAYVPFILNDLEVDAEAHIGILMMSSATVSNHVENYEKNAAQYTFYYYDGGASWISQSSKTIQWAISNFKWDIIMTHQSSWTPDDWSVGYQAELNKFISLILSSVDYPVRFAWMLSPSRPAQTNSGVNWSDETILSHFYYTASDAQLILNESDFDLVIPVGTAIQNARTIPAFKALGDYANNEKNASGLGYLCAFDGVHLQEGLPCQIAAYTFIVSMLRLLNLNVQSIYEDDTKITAKWTMGKSIPGPHGSVLLSTKQDREYAKYCAVAANDYPFEITSIVSMQ